MKRVVALLCTVAAFGWGHAEAQSFTPPQCAMGGAANYSATVTTAPVTLIPAAPPGIQRTGIFIELLTASASLGVNPTGGTPSTSAAPNIVITTGASAPQNTGFINFASMGFIPQGAITAVADSTGRVVTAYACPQ